MQIRSRKMRDRFTYFILNGKTAMICDKLKKKPFAHVECRICIIVAYGKLLHCEICFIL